MHPLRTISFTLNGYTFCVELQSSLEGYDVYTSINGYTQDVRHFDDYDAAESAYEFIVDFGKDLMWAIPEEIKES